MEIKEPDQNYCQTCGNVIDAEEIYCDLCNDDFVETMAEFPPVLGH